MLTYKPWTSALFLNPIRGRKTKDFPNRRLANPEDLKSELYKKIRKKKQTIGSGRLHFLS